MPVLIAGSGPAGLCLAIELGIRGIPCLLLDRNPGISGVLKANATQARTMEHYRRLGLAGEIRDLGLPRDYPTDVSYHTRYVTHELARLRLPPARDVKDLARAATGSWSTPELPHRCNQTFVERVLRRHAEQYPGNTLRYGWHLESFSESGAGVTAVAVESASGATMEVSCRFFVGCDGARSAVRSALGIALDGETDPDRPYASGRMCAIHLRSPAFYRRMKADRAWMYWSFNRDVRGLLIAVDGVDTFLFHVPVRDDARFVDGLGPAAMQRLAQEKFNLAFGAECPIEVISAGFWHAGYSLVADSFGRGRVWMAGDAVHLFTPHGGLGYNTAVDDVANLGWKLAAVIKGYGGAGLLPSYDSERRPAGIRNTGIAKQFADAFGSYVPSARLEENSGTGARERAAASARLNDHVRREFDIPGVTFGLRYDGSPIVCADGAPPPDEITRYQPSGVPGGRAPHLWTDDEVSLYDRFGRDFTLLGLDAGMRTGGWVAAAQARGIPLEVLDLGADRCVAEARELYGAGLVLIRPDQYVAWRGDDRADPSAVLSRVLGHV